MVSGKKTDRARKSEAPLAICVLYIPTNSSRPAAPAFSLRARRHWTAARAQAPTPPIIFIVTMWLFTFYYLENATEECVDTPGQPCTAGLRCMGVCFGVARDSSTDSKAFYRNPTSAGYGLE